MIAADLILCYKAHVLYIPSFVAVNPTNVTRSISKWLTKGKDKPHGKTLSPPTLTSLKPVVFSNNNSPHTRVGRGGYMLKDLEGQHEWRSGLYDKITVFVTRSYAPVILRPFSQGRLRSKADKYLGMSVSFSSQATPKVPSLT